MDEQRVWIDQATWKLTGPDRHHRFSEAEASRLPRPVCPGCGEEVWLRFQTTRDLGGEAPLILAGWECDNDCGSRQDGR